MGRGVFLAWMILITLAGFAQSSEVFLLKTSEIQIRNPFIYANEKDGLYYMYAVTKKPLQISDGLAGVMVYKS